MREWLGVKKEWQQWGSEWVVSTAVSVAAGLSVWWLIVIVAGWHPLVWLSAYLVVYGAGVHVYDRWRRSRRRRAGAA